MDRQSSELPGLVAAADQAYRVVRTEVIDALPPRVPIDVTALSSRQREALDALHQAETALANYREQSYASA